MVLALVINIKMVRMSPYKIEGTSHQTFLVYNAIHRFQ
jgi:hypothetical protein